MTDARFPERWLSDRRIIRLSDSAHRLFVTGLAWSASNRTDGLIEAADLPLIHGVDPSRATELTSAGLWKRVTEGWLAVDFRNTQTTRAQLDGLDHKRDMDRERKARERARKKGVGKGKVTHVVEPMSRVTSTVTSDVTQRQGQDRQGAPREVPTTEVERTEPEPLVIPPYLGEPGDDAIDYSGIGWDDPVVGDVDVRARQGEGVRR